MSKNEKKKTASTCCSPASMAAEICCKVESLLAVDERGQMVLPKSIRDKAGIKAGDKLALVTWEKNGNICCIALVKADEMAEMAKNMLSPLLKDMQ
jgi:antitoxin PrlF